MISDFVADVRAATPSNAMEIALPDINEHRIYLDNLQIDLQNRVKNILRHKEIELNNILKHFEQNSLEAKFRFINEQISILKSNYKNYLSQIFNTKQDRLSSLKESYSNNHPNKKSLKGYVQISQNNKIIELDEVKVDDTITLQTPKTIVYSTVKSVEKQY